MHPSLTRVPEFIWYHALVGAIVLLHKNFDVSNMQLSNNSAHFGGGIFISADLSSGTSMAYMTFSSNIASLGEQNSSQLHFDPCTHSYLHSCW